MIRELQRQINRTVYFGREGISSLAPSDIGNSNSLGILKEKIKIWITDKRSFRLCKTYIGNIGFT